MKHKRKQEELSKNKYRMRNPEIKKKNSLTVKEWIAVVGALFIYFFYAKSKDVILNYPNWLLYIMIILTSAIIAIFTFRDQKAKYLNEVEKKDRGWFIAFGVVKLIVVAYFISGMLLIPFNYYTIHSSKEAPLTYEKCEIVKITTETQNRKIFYRFRGKVNILYAYKPIMEELKNNGEYKEYFFVAGVREGNLNTYILESWDIERK